MITTIDCTWLELIDILPKLPDGSVVAIHEEGVNESTWMVWNGALERLAVIEEEEGKKVRIRNDRRDF